MSRKLAKNVICFPVHILGPSDNVIEVVSEYYVLNVKPHLQTSTVASTVAIGLVAAATIQVNTVPRLCREE